MHKIMSVRRESRGISRRDAIQMAVGIIYGADAFLTDDSSLKKVNDIRKQKQCNP